MAVIAGAEMQTGDGQGNGPLFAQIEFCIVLSRSLSEADAQKLTRVLEEHGAIRCPVTHDTGRIPLIQVTHIISTTSDFPDYEAAGEALIPVVKPHWVEASVTKRRLANPRQYSPDPRLFLSGVVVCCADLPSGDEDAIIGGVLAMGGLYSGVVTKQVTHIVALTTKDSKKCETALSKNLNCKIVLPHWFDDCLKLGKKIDERPYLLPDPEILRKRPDDPLNPLHVVENTDLYGASSPRPGPLPTPAGSPSPQRRGLRVFINKRVMLSQDLEIGSRLRGTIEDLISNAGGSVTGSVHKADIFVCHYREGKDYRVASRAGKDVGNLPWLYHLITHNAWTSPLRRLLHYPIARTGLPGFKGLRISLSNYNGEARVYLENLVQAAGGEFTKTMKQDNTHLITAHTVSEKCSAAKEWNVNMVNHIWLEESYAKWQIQSMTNARYTHFPQRTNLGEVVGQTQIDKQAIERYFFPKDTDTESADEGGHLPRPMQQKDRNISSINVPNSSAMQNSDSAKAHISGPSRTNFSDGPTPKASKDHRRHSEGATLRTPATPRFLGEGKENETPSTTGSRGAKDRAVAKLHELAPDIALYEKEKKRAGGVIFGGRKISEDREPNVGRKRSTSRDDESGVDGEEGRDVKRLKKPREPPSIRLLLSSYQRWVGQLRREDEEKAGNTNGWWRKRLRDLGILLVQDPSTCTHLAAPHIVRTQKFICALARAPTILSTSFVDQCLAKNELLAPEDFILNDPESEKRLGFTIQDALMRAKANKQRLLHLYTIYCTEGLHGGFETYKSIIEANGGRCMLYRARAGMVTSSRTYGHEEARERDCHDDSEVVYLISGLTPDEIRLWPKFRQMVQSSGKTPRIVKTDWMLDIALSQQIQWNDRYDLTEDDATSEA
ncbi:MAG: hypothetical protein M1830_008912 [Pleopsidium flavum]|nr:MAG: hypothetical protein M1830_008912 [Pleopsidium flavum]